MILVTERTAPAALEAIEKRRELVVDLETTGVRPYTGDRAFGAAIGTESEEYYFPFRHLAGTNLPPERFTQLLDILVDGRHTLGGHNFIRFDVPMLAMEGEKYARALLQDGSIPKWDTIIDALIANENEMSMSLDSLGRKYLGAGAVKGGNKERLLDMLRALPGGKRQAKTKLMGRLAELTPEQVAEYACGDVADCRALRPLYLAHHDAWELGNLPTEMYDYARLLAKIERHGLRIDAAECARRVEQCLAEQAVVLKRLRAEFGERFNPDAPQQVMRALGTPDAQARTVKRSGHRLAADIILFKRLGKMVSTYYQSMLDQRDEGDIIHPQMNLARDPRDKGGTRSCRLSCSNPNFQNLPVRSPEWFMQVREVVLARPGFSLLKNDYERAEMWMAAHYSRDDSLADAYYAGRDLYVDLATKTETDRQGAKVDWLAIQYGARGKKLSEMHDWPFKSVDELANEFDKDVEEWGDPEWRVYFAQKGPKVVKEFFELCPGIKAQMDVLTQHAEEQRCIRVWTGRVIHFDGRYTPPFTAWNRLIQGGVGEMVRHAMQRLEKPLEAIGAAMLLQVHDEIVVEAPEGREEEARRICRDVMCDFEFWLRPRIDTAVGETYGKMEKMKEAA